MDCDINTSPIIHSWPRTGVSILRLRIPIQRLRLKASLNVSLRIVSSKWDSTCTSDTGIDQVIRYEARQKRKGAKSAIEQQKELEEKQQRQTA